MSWSRALSKRCEHRRRAVVAVQIAIMLTAIMAVAALSFDVGAMYNTKTELQRTADAAALAAASKLAAYSEGDPIVLATALAHEYVAKNEVFGDQLSLAAEDVEFGRAVYNEATGSYDFNPTNSFPDAVRVRVRMTDDSPNGEMELFFAKVMGNDSTGIEAEAIAMMVPRDIAVVADLSGSHTDDSELRNYDETNINLHEVWDNFPGGIGDEGGNWDGDEFDLDDDGYSPQMAGPAWGYFKQLGWGDETIDSGYNPKNDSGLIRLAKGQNWSDSDLKLALEAQGYIPAEVDAIMSGTYDTHSSYPAYDDRVAVALGLARWNSGMPGGLWEQLGMSPYDAGNGNDWLSGSELTWLESFGDRSLEQSQDVWMDYINNYMPSRYTQMARANRYFRYRYGLKTFINYLMERTPEHENTPELANTPHQPMQSVKDAVSEMTQLLYDLETDDQLSLEVYGTTARHEIDLTDQYSEVSDRLNEMQGGHYDVYTNMGGGITRGIEELTSERARPTSRKVIILLTDGKANVDESGDTGDYWGGEQYARDMAEEAAAQGIRLFSVSVGSDSDIDLMQYIASVGDGQHFHAEGDIESYSAQLHDIFMTLGGTRPVELIK